jgi:hypothetical protein
MHVKTHVVNLIGGPGVGKTTMAHLLVYLASIKHVSAAFVPEYVKSWALESRPFRPYDELYFLGKQARYESIHYGRSELIVTDKPLVMDVMYARKFSPQLAGAVEQSVTSLMAMAEQELGVRYANVVLKRVHPYQTHGRYQDEAGAREMDVDMVGILKELGMETIVAEPTEVATKQLFARLERWRKCPEIRWGSQLLDLVL